MGKFEEMYVNSLTSPWHQNEQEHWIDVRLAKEILQVLGRFDEIHDFGCGTGHYLDLVAKHSIATNGKCYGYDISATACEKAKKLFPNYNFSVLDLTQSIVSNEQRTTNNEQRTTNNEQRTTNNEQPKRIFMIRGTLWYVIPKLATVIENIANKMSYSDRLLVVQNFPSPHSTFYGKDVMPDHFALLRHFSSHFTVDNYIWYEDLMKEANDNWFIGFFSFREKN